MRVSAQSHTHYYRSGRKVSTDDYWLDQRADDAAFAVQHEGATAEWSPIAEVAKAIESRNEDEGHWEVILHRIVVDFPSLAELFEWMLSTRREVMDNQSTIEIRWRWDA